jgi:hypothetical protein
MLLRLTRVRDWCVGKARGLGNQVDDIKLESQLQSRCCQRSYLPGTHQRLSRPKSRPHHVQRHGPRGYPS